MKKKMNCFVFLLWAIFCISCTKEEFLKSEDKVFENGVLVFLNTSDFKKDTSETEENVMLAVKSEVKKFAKKHIEDLKLEDSNIHIGKELWFFADTISSKQLAALAKKPKGVLDYLPNYPMDIQGRPPMMQSNPILQGRKPQMQEDWRYDSAMHSSKLVLWIGGGDVSTLPPASPGRTVWIMDTGIDPTHQDLAGVVATDRGFDATGSANFLRDGNGHGTLIAGLIGARAHNQAGTGNPADIGINGIFPGAAIVSVKVMNQDGASSINWLAQGLQYLQSVVKKGDVINISLGRENNSAGCQWGTLGQMFRNLAAKGVYLVFSAGNDASPNSSNFPSCLADGNFMLSVGSMNMFCEGEVLLFSSFSNYGEMTGATPASTIWLAPGEQIFSTFPPSLVNSGADRGVYAEVSGTSYSAAIISGVLYTLGERPALKDSLLRGGEGNYYYVPKIR